MFPQYLNLFKFKIMKRDFLLSTLFISILLLSSCKKDPPLALFSMDKSTFKVNETITFTNQSENAKSYAWDFGDGKTSTDENPKHAYSSAGDFTITLTATGGGGIDSISQTISVLQNLTGIWRKTLNFGGLFSINGTMNLTQHDDNTLTGSYVYEDGMGTFNLRSTSKITGNSVIIEWQEAAYKFQGTVNAAGTSMGGEIFANTQSSGTWTATKL
ncbi:MAG: PKD domain-containing protein [Porphyromonadaceae bacterium]|nr:MAG: PKD domain-containing protein [Porphyromonadaceae bacterium]